MYTQLLLHINTRLRRNMKPTKYELTTEQALLVNAVIVQRKNVFFTGSGGTGKSFMIGHIKEQLHMLYGGLSVAITATTGRAAFNVGGVTLHSFAGIGLGAESKEVLADKVRRNKVARGRWMTTKVLIIDEVSMMSGALFDKVEYVARKVKQKDVPFGGIQLILVGDLLQLPPVSTEDRALRPFQASTWDSCVDVYIRLEKVFRQSDMEFVKALTCIRVGHVDDNVRSFIKSVSREVKYEDGLEPVILYSTRSKADALNTTRLDAIDSDIVTYYAVDETLRKSQLGSSLLDQCPAPKVIDLKLNAQVMMVKNSGKHLVNGTIGTVVGFVRHKEEAYGNKYSNVHERIPVVRFTLANGRMYTQPIKREIWETTMPDGQVQCRRNQIPLILAWAITIHKSQSQTIQRLKVDLSGIFETGQVYTALSRAVSPESLEVVGFGENQVVADQEALAFCIDKDII